MAKVIAHAIIAYAEVSAEDGKAKYDAYFSKSYFKKYKADVDKILREEGYEEVIMY